MGKILRALSLDVVLGAWASGGMLLWMLGLEERMEWAWWVGLGLAVWLAYTADHLMDAWRLGADSHTFRHRFHHEYFREIAAVWVLAVVAGMGVFYFSSVPLRCFALAVGGLSLLHFAVVKWVGERRTRWFHKEYGVAIIYTLGICAGPLSLFSEHLSLENGLIYGQFLMMVLINLVMISIYERDTDRKDGHSSLVLARGRRRSQIMIVVFGAAHLAVGLWLLWQGVAARQLVVEAVFLLMLLLLLGVSFGEKYFGQRERYRIWGDAVFVLPAFGYWLLAVGYWLLAIGF